MGPEIEDNQITQDNNGKVKKKCVICDGCF